MAGMMMDIFMIMAVGGTCCFADKDALKGTLLENIKHYQPTRFMGVTRIFEKIEEGIKKQGAGSRYKHGMQTTLYSLVFSGVRKRLGDWAKRQATAHHTREMSGKVDNR